MPTSIHIDNIGPSDPVRILDETGIWVAIDEKTYTSWQRGGGVGNSFYLVEPNGEGDGEGRTDWYKFYVLGEDFALENIMMEEWSYCPIRIGVDEGEGTTPFQFDVNIVDPILECAIGGERIIVDNEKEIGLRSSRSTKEESLIRISPNPVSEILSIKLSEDIIEMEVVDSYGRKLYSDDINEENLELDVSAYNSGTYYIVGRTLEGELEIVNFVKH